MHRRRASLASASWRCLSTYLALRVPARASLAGDAMRAATLQRRRVRRPRRAVQACIVGNIGSTSSRTRVGTYRARTGGTSAAHRKMRVIQIPIPFPSAKWFRASRSNVLSCCLGSSRVRRRTTRAACSKNARSTVLRARSLLLRHRGWLFGAALLLSQAATRPSTTSSSKPILRSATAL